MNNQQKQTKNYFEKFSKEWQARSKNKKFEMYNTVQQRNNYVFNYIKKYKPKHFLDVGCGSGELILMSSKFTNTSLGIDFSKAMINLCEKKNNKKNVKFIASSFFDLNLKENSFDLISANGFIEYISIEQLHLFLKICKKILKKNGKIIFSSRNRLFNLFSLNDFSKKEINNSKSLKFLFKESIDVANKSFKNFINLKNNLPLIKISDQKKTTINVNIRYQFTPLQLINLINKFYFKTLDIYPINYHPVIPKNYKLNEKNIRIISNKLLKTFPKMNMIPYSSAFMIIGKCIK